jgi:radical SAM superfamily enzyme YgiQ (UPF0313 family)
MKKILFIALNSSWSQSNLALYYLREMISDLPYEAKMLSFTLKEPLHQVLESIYFEDPDVLCFSAYIWNRIFLENLQRELSKVLPRAIFVIGGPEAEGFMKATNCIAIFGAGEAAFKELAERDFCTPVESRKQIQTPLKDIPFPYRTEDVDQLGGHLIYYECFRGCPYSCVYCLSAQDKRSENRFDLNIPQDVLRLNEELGLLCALEPKTLKFIDRSFNFQKDLAHHIWTFLIETRPGFDTHFEIYPDLIDAKDIEVLSRAPAGLIRFEVGIQSTNDSILKNSGRYSDWDKSRNTLLELKSKTEIRIHADLLVGLPGEEIDSILNSINELCSCEPDAVQLGMLKILPDTPMQDIARQRGYLWMDLPPYQILQTDSLSFSQLCLLSDYAHLLNLYWNKEEFKESWHIMLQDFSAIHILDTLKRSHEARKLPLHSLSRQKRELVMQELSTLL